MSDAYSILPSFFSDDPRTGALTYDQLQARQKIAMALATRNRPYPKTIGEGLTAFGEGLGEGFGNARLARAEAAQRQRDEGATQSLTGSRPVPGGASLEGDPTQALALAAPADTAPPAEPAPPPAAVPPTPEVAPAPTRDTIAQAMVAQQQPPLQQVAQAGPAPLPQPPPSVAGGLPPPPPAGAPTVTPQSIPRLQAQPAQPVSPGAEPKLRDYIEGNPQLNQQMQNARRIAGDLNLNPSVRAQGAAIYSELEKRANDAYTKQWTVWHERTKAQEAFKLGEEDKILQRTKLRGEAEDEAEKRVLKYRFGGIEPGEGFKKLEKDQTAAELATKVRDDNRIILQAVRDGVIMGTGAGWRVSANKLAAWALQNGYASEQAANTEILRALGGSRIREALSQVNPVGVASNTDLLLARQLSGAEATMEPKSFMALLHKSSLHNSRLINDYEDKIDYTLGGTRAQRQFEVSPTPTAPRAATDKMLANRDDKAVRAAYDNTYGEGSSALEIERFKRRNRGQ